MDNDTNSDPGVSTLEALRRVLVLVAERLLERATDGSGTTVTVGLDLRVGSYRMSEEVEVTDEVTVEVTDEQREVSPE